MPCGGDPVSHTVFVIVMVCAVWLCLAFAAFAYRMSPVFKKKR